MEKVRHQLFDLGIASSFDAGNLTERLRISILLPPTGGTDRNQNTAPQPPGGES